MALQRVNIGTRPDGSPLYHYYNPDGGDLHVVFTGDHTGEVDVDGTVYNVTDPVIEVQSQEHGIKAAAILEDRKV